MTKKARFLLGSTFITGLLIIAFVIGYVSFTINTLVETAFSITVDGGNLNLAFAGENKIVLNKHYGEDTKLFTVTGNTNSDLPLGYSLVLVIDQNAFSDNIVSYALASFNTSENGETIPSIIEKQAINSQADRYLLGSGFFIDSENAIHTYMLSVSIDSKLISNNSLKAHLEIIEDNKVG